MTLLKIFSCNWILNIQSRTSRHCLSCPRYWRRGAKAISDGILSPSWLNSIDRLSVVLISLLRCSTIFLPLWYHTYQPSKLLRDIRRTLGHRLMISIQPGVILSLTTSLRNHERRRHRPYTTRWAFPACPRDPGHHSRTQRSNRRHGYGCGWWFYCSSVSSSLLLFTFVAQNSEPTGR